MLGIKPQQENRIGIWTVSLPYVWKDTQQCFQGIQKTYKGK